MSPKTLVNFFLKKIGLNKLLFRLARSEAVNTDGDSANAALKRLEALSPFPCGSSVCIGKREVPSNEVDVHIIIPCYNAEKYILGCLQSINLKHSYIVTVVDDGSIDGSSKVLERFSNNPHYEIKHKANGGSASARNYGMYPRIRGRYVVFIDSDDYINSEILDKMIDVAIERDCDIVQGDAIYITRSGRKKRRRNYNHGSITPMDLDGVPWGKVLKNDLFLNNQFPDGFYFEDTNMSFIVYQNASKIYGFNGAFYYYRLVAGSASHQTKNFKNIDTLYVVLRLFDDRVSLGYESNKYIYHKLINQSGFLYQRLIGLGVGIVKDAFIVYSEFIQNIYKQFHFDINDKRLKELEQSLLKSDFGKFIAAAKYL